MIKEEFIAFLMAKNIDAVVFEQKDPSLFSDWLYLFGQMSSKSFLTQKLFLINQIRRKYQLPISENKKTSKTDKVSKPIVKGVIKTQEGDKNTAPKPKIAKPKLKPTTSAVQKPKIPVKPLIKKVASDSTDNSENSSSDLVKKTSPLKPAIPKGNKPSLKPKIPVKKVVAENVKKAALAPKIPSKKPKQVTKEDLVVISSSEGEKLEKKESSKSPLKPKIPSTKTARSKPILKPKVPAKKPVALEENSVDSNDLNQELDKSVVSKADDTKVSLKPKIPTKKSVDKKSPLKPKIPSKVKANPSTDVVRKQPMRPIIPKKKDD